MASITLINEPLDEQRRFELPAAGIGRYLVSSACLRATNAMRGFASLYDVAVAPSLTFHIGETVEGGRGRTVALQQGAPLRIRACSDGQAWQSRAGVSECLDLDFTLVIKCAAGRTAGPGFASGAEIRYSYRHPVDGREPSMTVEQMITRLLSAAVYPLDLDDLRALRCGATATVAGRGQLSVAKEVVVDVLANGDDLHGGRSSLGSGIRPGAAIDAGWIASGGIAICATRRDESSVTLAFHRDRSHALSVNVVASPWLTKAADAPTRMDRLLAALGVRVEPARAPGTIAGSGTSDLTAATEIVSASLDRSLTNAARDALALVDESEPLFAYDVNVRSAESELRSAVSQALHGDLTGLEMSAMNPNGPVRRLASAVRIFEAARPSWNVCLPNEARTSPLEMLRHLATASVQPEGTLTAKPRA